MGPDAVLHIRSRLGLTRRGSVGRRPGSVLKEHRQQQLSKGLYRPDAFVFTTGTGAPMHGRNIVERGVTKAANKAGLNKPGLPALSPHDLRHSFASHLIRSGADVYSVSRQLGHARASTTLDVYAHEFAKAQHGETLRQQLAAAFGGAECP
jgi:site-specific recombinase XerD